MWHLSRPSPETVATFLAHQRTLPQSYAEVGASLDGSPAGYDLDHNRVQVGSGERDFVAACAAIRAWRMFPAPSTAIEPRGVPIEKDQCVAMLAHTFGVWWLNACRIVYVLDEHEPRDGRQRRFGFAYGTLPGHVERGEERFSIEWRADDSVWYDIRAFSRPRYWPVRLGYPIARALQRRFVRDSKAAMQHAVRELGPRRS